MAQPTKTITIRVTPDYQRELKTYLASKGLTIQDYVRGLIDKDMKENKGGK